MHLAGDALAFGQPHLLQAGLVSPPGGLLPCRLRGQGLLPLLDSMADGGCGDDAQRQERGLHDDRLIPVPPEALHRASQHRCRPGEQGLRQRTPPGEIGRQDHQGRVQLRPHGPQHHRGHQQFCQVAALASCDQGQGQDVAGRR